MFELDEMFRWRSVSTKLVLKHNQTFIDKSTKNVILLTNPSDNTPSHILAWPLLAENMYN